MLNQELLSRDITDFNVAYSTFVNDCDEVERNVREWYHLAWGHEPALSDVHHAYWRCMLERDRWKTLGRALQEAWPIHAPAPEAGELKRLFPQRTYLIKDGGERFTAKEATSFRLYKRFLDGEDIHPVLDQLRSIGFNMVRIFGVGDWGDPLYRCIPREYGARYYDSLPEFAALLASYGLYLEFTALADSPRVFPGGTPEQVEHWNKLCSVASGIPSVLLELVNENDVPVNSVDTNAFQKPDSITASHGSNGSQAHPVDPMWDYATFHTNGSFEEQRKIGHNAWEIWGGPTITNETSRFPEVGMWRNSDLDRQEMLAYDSAAGAALLCAGACFHSVNGKLAYLLNSNEEAVARAWVAGMNSVPLEFQDGAYIRRDDFLSDSTVLRAYERRLNDGRGHVVVIHK